MREIKNILAQFSQASEPMALATIVGTQGSSYRRAGTRMLVLANGETVGTLSGGCIEMEVAARSQSVILSGQPERFTIDTLRFGCPGSLDIFLERIEPGNAFLSYLARSFAERTTAEILVSPQGSLPLSCAASATKGFRQMILPPVRLIIVGTGSDTDALLHFSHILGWDTAVLEPLELSEVIPDERTSIVIKNHHFGRDVAALSESVKRPFGYVGLLSSQKRKRQLFNLLEHEGFLELEPNLDHFHGPAGMDLGADSPEEIALSIIAEIQAVMSRHAGGFLRDVTHPIHQCLAH